ncbi:LamG domain-containing protein [Candidatus Poribacteria bacterium]|nr:LamG domain-containing protein [Candidatus Poribacteria bacterium]MYA58581.1 LamG domain-containing protein [Candidatus Poribacteria bacterium]
MKSVIVYLAIITMSLALAVQTDAEIDFETARGIWLLDEGKGDKIEDISGNENHGELQGGKWAKGPDGPALSLNGQDDRVIIPDSKSMYLEKEWSITSWVYVNKSENGYGHILGKRPAAGTVANYAFRTNSSGTGWEAYFANGGWKGAWNQSQVKKDEWLYMTATYDAKDTIKIYENAEEIASVGGMGKPAPQNDTDVNIGGWTNNTSETLDGMLYDVAIFASVLEAEDIEELMEKGLKAALPVEPAGKLATTWGGIKSRR